MADEMPLHEAIKRVAAKAAVLEATGKGIARAPAIRNALHTKRRDAQAMRTVIASVVKMRDMIDRCAACGHDLRSEEKKPISRGPFTVTYDPLRITYLGDAVPVRGYRARIMAALVENGSINREAMIAIGCSEDADENAAKVHLCHLRRELSDFEPGLGGAVETTFGVAGMLSTGLRLNLERMPKLALAPYSIA